MKKRLGMLILVLGLALAGCSGDNAAEQLLETAKLEELQDNREHAKKLYEEIVNAYPESRYAKEAQSRLSVLQEGR
jgi:TolA-binding protein